MVFSDDVKAVFAAADQSDEIEAFGTRLDKIVAFRIGAVKYGARDASDETKAICNSRLVVQSAIHRSAALVAAFLPQISSGNIYASSVLARAQIESTVMVGYLCTRLRSARNNTINTEKLCIDTADLLIGTRHEMFKNMVEAKSIMHLIDSADKLLTRELGIKPDNMLRDSYEWLSDFAHPNFLSNIQAYKIDSSTGIASINLELSRTNSLDIFGYLDLSFIAFDVFVEHALKSIGVLSERFGSQD